MEPESGLAKLAIEPVRFISPELRKMEKKPEISEVEISAPEKEEIVVPKPKVKSKPFQEYEEDMVNEKVRLTLEKTKKNRVEMYRRSTSSQFWNGFGNLFG